MSNEASVKKFFKCLLALIALTLLFFIILILCASISKEGIREMISIWKANHVFEIYLILLLGFIGYLLLMPLLEIGVPFAAFAFGKIGFYFSMLFICLRKRYKIRFGRFPFSSLRGIREKADIQIRMHDQTFYLHFVDVPLPLLRIIDFANDGEYRVYSTVRGKVKRLGGSGRANMSGQRTMAFWGNEREISQKQYWQCKIPAFPTNEGEFHFLVVNPGFANAKYTGDHQSLDISAEVPMGNVIVCRAKTIKKRVSDKLHSPLNKSTNHERKTV